MVYNNNIIKDWKKMRENNIKEDLENYINWCKSQGTGLNPQEWLTFCFYMEHVYPYADGCIHMHM